MERRTIVGGVGAPLFAGGVASLLASFQPGLAGYQAGLQAAGGVGVAAGLTTWIVLWLTAGPKVKTAQFSLDAIQQLLDAFLRLSADDHEASYVMGGLLDPPRARVIGITHKRHDCEEPPPDHVRRMRLVLHQVSDAAQAHGLGETAKRASVGLARIDQEPFDYSVAYKMLNDTLMCFKDELAKRLA